MIPFDGERYLNVLRGNYPDLQDCDARVRRLKRMMPFMDAVQGTDGWTQSHRNDTLDFSRIGSQRGLGYSDHVVVDIPSGTVRRTLDAHVVDASFIPDAIRSSLAIHPSYDFQLMTEMAGRKQNPGATRYTQQVCWLAPSSAYNGAFVLRSNSPDVGERWASIAVNVPYHDMLQDGMYIDAKRVGDRPIGRSNEVSLPPYGLFYKFHTLFGLSLNGMTLSNLGNALSSSIIQTLNTPGTPKHPAFLVAS